MKRLLLAALLASALTTRPAAEGTAPTGGLGIRGAGGHGAVKPVASAAPAPVDRATVLGHVDGQRVREVVVAHADEVRACFEAARIQAPRLQGRVVLKWIIQPDGSVTNAAVERPGTTVSSDEVLACMISRLGSWTFPSPGRGGIAVITYPWDFRIAEPATPAEEHPKAAR